MRRLPTLGGRGPCPGPQLCRQLLSKATVIPALGQADHWGQPRLPVGTVWASSAPCPQRSRGAEGPVLHHMGPQVVPGGQRGPLFHPPLDGSVWPEHLPGTRTCLNSSRNSERCGDTVLTGRHGGSRLSPRAEPTVCGALSAGAAGPTKCPRAPRGGRPGPRLGAATLQSSPRFRRRAPEGDSSIVSSQVMLSNRR